MMLGPGRRLTGVNLGMRQGRPGLLAESPWVKAEGRVRSPQSESRVLNGRP